MLSVYVLFVMLAIEPQLDPVKVYCYSIEGESGFIDEETEKWCKKLDKDGSKKSILTVVNSIEDSDVSVLRQDTTSSVSNSTMTRRIPYTTLQVTESTGKTYTSHATITVGDFSKSFHGDIKAWIIDWVELNQAIILEKTRR